MSRRMPSKRAFRPSLSRSLWAATLAVAAAGWGIHAALAVDPPRPSDAGPEDGPVLDATEAPSLAPAAEQPIEGVEVLTRGPVHEAFAETVSFDPKPGVVVPKAPPEAIEELPPDQKPEGDNVDWIPGYWGWDDERNDFLWVSGIWRAMPPDRQWISGYWREATGGYQWVTGYWGDAAATQVEYLPAPPATLEVGPNVAAPSVDQSWIPGTWIWRQTRFVWRPGYWIAPQPNWVWVPAYYVWAPGGCIFVNGYWDYLPIQRGVLFAPIYFTAGVYARPGFFYSPATVISLNVFDNHLFCRPGYNHYYFGDYYAANYAGLGFYPWFSFHMRGGYDPFWAHQKWHHRNDRDWARQVESEFRHLRDHKDARPPRTWDDVKTLAAKGDGQRDHSRMVATSLDKMAKEKNAPYQFHKLDKDSRTTLAAREKDMQKFRQERQKMEATTNVRVTKQPAKFNLPKTSIASRSVEQLGKGQAPPKRPAASASDVAGQPTQSVPRFEGQSRTRQEGSTRTREQTNVPRGDQSPRDPTAIKKQMERRAAADGLTPPTTPTPETSGNVKATTRQPVPRATDRPAPQFKRSQTLSGPSQNSLPSQQSAPGAAQRARSRVQGEQSTPSARQSDAGQGSPRVSRPEGQSQSVRRSNPSGSQAPTTRGPNKQPPPQEQKVKEKVKEKVKKPKEKD